MQDLDLIYKQYFRLQQFFQTTQCLLVTLLSSSRCQQWCPSCSSRCRTRRLNSWWATRRLWRQSCRFSKAWTGWGLRLQSSISQWDFLPCRQTLYPALLLQVWHQGIWTDIVMNIFKSTRLTWRACSSCRFYNRECGSHACSRAWWSAQPGAVFAVHDTGWPLPTLDYTIVRLTVTLLCRWWDRCGRGTLSRRRRSALRASWISSQAWALLIGRPTFKVERWLTRWHSLQDFFFFDYLTRLYCSTHCYHGRCECSCWATVGRWIAGKSENPYSVFLYYAMYYSVETIQFSGSEPWVKLFLCDGLKAILVTHRWAGIRWHTLKWEVTNFGFTAKFSCETTVLVKVQLPWVWKVTDITILGLLQQGEVFWFILIYFSLVLFHNCYRQ